VKNLDFFECPKSQGRDRVRWDICISRTIEARKNKKRSKCTKCPKTAELVKALVMEVWQ
jgi:hypothetical protein